MIDNLQEVVTKKGVHNDANCAWVIALLQITLICKVNMKICKIICLHIKGNMIQ